MEEPQRQFTLYRVSAFVTIAVFLAFGAGYMLARHQDARVVAAAALVDAPQGVDFSPVWKAWNILNENFVPDAVATSSPIATSTTELNQQKVWGMVSGLAASLNDPYTFFLPPAQNTQFGTDLSGQFGGVGMEIDVKGNVLTVTSPLKGTPAEKAGIKAGDEILKIDGVSTQGMDASSAVNKIRGPKGTPVTLTIYREGWGAPRDIKVVRDTITVPIVTTAARKDGVFVITVLEFTSNAPDLFRDALRQFVQSGDTKLVLDLRGNPGGYLDGAVNIASWFLPPGAVVVTEDYDGHAQNIVHRSLGYNIFNKNLKAVILVDKGSASASEIFADAMRYYGVAKLVGTNTFGKGVVQELFPITDTTSLKVTVARWLGPDGIQIPHEGLTPDIMATTTDEAIKAGTDEQMNRAVEILNQ